MAKSVNTLTVSGNLGADPEITYAASGTAIARARLAVSDRRKSKSGTWEDETVWLGVTVFGKSAEFFAQYGFKGCPVTVTGRLEVREYQDREGATKTAVGVVASDFALHGRKDREGMRTDTGRAPAGDEEEGFSDQF